MPIQVTCTNCGSRFRVRDTFAGGYFTCKTCATQVSVADPNEDDSADDGFLAALDEASAAEVGASSMPKLPARQRRQPQKAADEWAPREDSTLPEITWDDVLRSPFDEEVLGMSFLMLGMYFLWVCGSLLVGVAASIVIFMFTMAGIYWFGWFLAGLGVVYYVLRMYAYYIGQYFAILERFALGALFSRQDRPWQEVLGFAVGVAALAVGPAAANVALCTLVFDGTPIIVGSWIMAYLWVALYAPMGTGVAVLKRTLNPATVIEWIWLCWWDYVLFFVVSGVYNGLVALAWLASVWVLSLILPDGGFWAKFVSFALTFLVGQYMVVAQSAMFGTVLRRHEMELDYLTDDDD